MAGAWGVIAVGLFASSPPDMDTTQGRSGLVHGEWPLLGFKLAMSYEGLTKDLSQVAVFTFSACSFCPSSVWRPGPSSLPRFSSG